MCVDTRCLMRIVAMVCLYMLSNSMTTSLVNEYPLPRLQKNRALLQVQSSSFGKVSDTTYSIDSSRQFGVADQNYDKTSGLVSPSSTTYESSSRLVSTTPIPVALRQTSPTKVDYSHTSIFYSPIDNQQSPGPSPAMEMTDNDEAQSQQDYSSISTKSYYGVNGDGLQIINVNDLSPSVVVESPSNPRIITYIDDKPVYLQPVVSPETSFSRSFLPLLLAGNQNEGQPTSPSVFILPEEKSTFIPDIQSSSDTTCPIDVPEEARCPYPNDIYGQTNSKVQDLKMMLQSFCSLLDMSGSAFTASPTQECCAQLKQLDPALLMSCSCSQAFTCQSDFNQVLGPSGGGLLSVLEACDMPLYTGMPQC